MNILGIDYGDKKVGVAIADSKSNLAEPMQVIKYESLGKLVKDIKAIVEKENIKKIVVGISEGESEKKARDFGNDLAELNVEVVFQDETLSTVFAQQKSVESGMKRVKRQKKEDAFAATVILQNYLDTL